LHTGTETARSAAAARSVRIRETRPDDYAQIAALHLRNGLTMRPFDHWIALWSGNPAYRGAPLGWVLEDGDGAIAGSIGNVPLAYEFRGRTLNAATPFGWVADPAFRGYSIMILNRFLRQSGIDLFVFSSVGDKAEPVYRGGFQLQPVPAGAWNRAALWVTGARCFARSLLQRHKIPFAGTLSLPLAGAIWTAGRPWPALEEPAGYGVDLCAQFDWRFDEFWETLRAGAPHLLLAVRSRDALTWHFRHLMDSTYVLAITKDSRLTAFAIFCRQDNPELGLKRVRFIDFQSLEGHSATLRVALAWMLRECRARGIHVLEVMGSWLDRADLPPVSAPFERKLSCWTFYYKANAPELAHRLRDPGVWVPTSFDGDASL
jgi:hypothetical protein